MKEQVTVVQLPVFLAIVTRFYNKGEVEFLKGYLFAAAAERKLYTLLSVVNDSQNDQECHGFIFLSYRTRSHDSV